MLFLEACTLAERGIQNLLSDPEVLGSYLQQFVGVDEVKGLLQGKNLGRNKAKGFISGRGTGVGELLFLADVDLDVLAASGLTNHHSGIYLFSGSNEEETALLCIKESVGDGFTVLKSYK